MNEVEIVVKSSDRTNLSGIGQKFRSQVQGAVQSSMKNVDDTISTGFKKAGEKAGQEFDGALKKSIKDVDKTVTAKVKETGEKAGAAFGEALDEGLSKADHVITLKVKRTVNGWNEVVTHKLRQTGEEGGQALYESLGSSVSRVASIGQHMGKQTSSGMMSGLRGGLSTPVIGAVIAAALIGAVVGLGPLIGGLLAGGIVAAFGLGLAGIGMFFGAEMKKVDGQWKIGVKSIREKAKALGKDIGSGFREISKPFRSTWHGMLDTVRSVGRRFKPILKDAFKDFIAPATTRFIKNLGLAFEELAPAIKPLSRAFRDLMDQLGPKLPTIFEGISDALIDLSDTISENPELFANMIANILELIPFVIRLVDKLAEAADWVSDNSDWLQPLVEGALALGSALGPLAALIDKVFPDSNKPSDTIGRNKGDPLRVGTGIPGGKPSTKPHTMVMGIDVTDVQRRIGEVNKQLSGWAKRQWKAVVTLGARGVDAVQNHLRKVAAGVRNIKGKTIRLAQNGADAVVSHLKRVASGVRNMKGKTIRLAQTGADAIRRHIGRVMSGVRNMRGKTIRLAQSGASAVIAQIRSIISWVSRIRDRVVNIGVNFMGAAKRALGFAHGGVVGMAAGGISRAAEGGARSALTMVGEAGPELVNLPAGSRVRSNPDTRRLMAGGGDRDPIVIRVESGGSRLDDLLVEILRKAVRARGGNVQLVLGKG